MCGFGRLTPFQLRFLTVKGGGRPFSPIFIYFGFYTEKRTLNTWASKRGGAGAFKVAQQQRRGRERAEEWSRVQCRVRSRGESDASEGGGARVVVRRIPRLGEGGAGWGRHGGRVYPAGVGRKALGVDERSGVGRRCWGCGGIRYPPCAEGRLEKGRGRAGVAKSAVYRAGQGGAPAGGEGGSEELLGATRVAKEASRGPRRRGTARRVRRGGWGGRRR